MKGRGNQPWVYGASGVGGVPIFSDGELSRAPAPSAVLLLLIVFAIHGCNGSTGPVDAGADAALDAPAMAHPFDVLVDDMDRHYSYFAHNSIDWAELTGRYRAAALETTTASELVEVVLPMLAELGDLHVWIVRPDGAIVPTVEVDAPLVDYVPFAASMSSVQQIGQVAFTARTSEGFGFAAIGSLQLSDAEERELTAALEGLFDTPGIIIDLRNNGGGDELTARRLAAMFTDEARVYAHSQSRNGPGHDDFTEPAARTLEPRGAGPVYEGPVVVVTGPRTMSSAEAFVLMFRTMPTVTVIGQSTRGSSGNPAPIDLDNGITVYYSRWKALDEHREPFEGTGLAPDVPLPADADVLAAAREVFEG